MQSSNVRPHKHALFLQLQRNFAGVLVARFQPVGNQNQNIAGVGVYGKIVGRLQQRVRYGRIAFRFQHPQLTLNLRRGIWPERHFQLGVLAIVQAVFVLVAVGAQTHFQVLHGL